MLRGFIILSALFMATPCPAFEYLAGIEALQSFRTANLNLSDQVNTSAKANTIGGAGKLITGNVSTKYTFTPGFSCAETAPISKELMIGGANIGPDRAKEEKSVNVMFGFDAKPTHQLEFIYLTNRINPYVITRWSKTSLTATKKTDEKTVTLTEDYNRTLYGVGAAAYLQAHRNLNLEAKAAFSRNFTHVSLGGYMWSNPDYFLHAGWNYDIEKLGELTVKSSAPFIGLQYNF